MDLWSILKTVGTGVIASVAGPAAPLVIGAINAALPDDAQLPDNATGLQAQAAVNSIPAEQRAQLLNRQFDVEITDIKESHSTVRMMLESDAANPQSTRPYIAKHSFHIIAFSSIAITVAWSYAVYTDQPELVKSIQQGAIFVAALNATLATILLAYFGTIRKEHKQKMDAASGVTQPSGIAGLISGLVNRNGK